jgi:uncharacterized RDD family membrane protein YckC
MCSASAQGYESAVRLAAARWAAAIAVSAGVDRGGQMGTMPERDMPEQQAGTGQSAGPADSGGSSYGSGPAQQDWTGTGPGGYAGQQQGGQQWGGQQAGGQRGWDTPVNVAETRVTGRRVIQYWIDAFLVSIVPMLVSIPFDRSNSTLLHVLGGVVYVVLFALIGLWYWVIRPHSHGGQTFAMKWLGLRVISKHGGPANMTQLFVRWVSLLIDSAPWFWPVTGLVGLIVMLCSHYRQRIGDHLARTLVVDARLGGLTRDQQFAGAGQSGLTSASR